MDLEKYLLDQQNSLDNRESNNNKIYFILVDQEIYCHGTNLKDVGEIYKSLIEESLYKEVELAWVWENDFDPGKNSEETKRLREPMIKNFL